MCQDDSDKQHTVEHAVCGAFSRGQKVHLLMVLLSACNYTLVVGHNQVNLNL